MKVYFTKGFPGCGKSTLAKKLVLEAKGQLIEVNRDDLRLKHPKWKRNRFSKEVEGDVLKERDALMREALDNGKDVISSDTNLTKTSLTTFTALAKKYKADLVCLDFTDPSSEYYVSLEECFKRDLLREYSVGKDVILRMHYEQLAKTVQEPEWHDVLPNAFVFDIDGTLAHHEGLRGAFEERYEVDSVDKTVLYILKALRKDNKIIVLSGREGSAIGEAKTKQWLKDNDIPYDEFYMRACGDRRKDTIVKKELYEQKIKFRYNIIGVFDDRPSVCRMWEQQGLKVLKCGPGIEF